INNPLGSIISNIAVLRDHLDKFLEVMRLYRSLRQAITEDNKQKTMELLKEIDLKALEYDLDFVLEDALNIYKESLQSAERIKSIIQDLKTFARQDNSVNAPANVHEIIDGVLNIVHNELKYKSVLIKEYAHDLPEIVCNKQQLGQVFINVLINAVQSIEKRGEIHIRTYAKDGMVCVAISDTGRGISKENMNKLFEPFFTTKDVGQGTGLGLSVSHDIIRQHGGTITVASEEGKGATFTISLPAQ
ncbi:MAG: GHKL domain-containing protein, partial [Candidatus Omnitrophica bacterium]|nr:GHKL domain-containing protein [Candidatus Omnitrophota bacterium]